MRATTLAAPALCLMGLLTLSPSPANAQAPAARSGQGGGVGASVTQPTTPQGAAPPGTPSAETTGDRALRDAAGQNVLGKTDTPATAVPGNTTAPDSGVRK
jgi:hypothetical protein